MNLPELSEYTFDVVWPTPSPEVRDGVAKFWEAENALDHARATQRSQEVALVARARDRS